MDRVLEVESVEGEIALIIEYTRGESLAIDVLQAAMELICALDSVDKVLLSSIDTSLEPVSLLNDVQHSSLKMLLARALRKIPDECLKNMDWKKWLGNLLVTGKHKLLSKLEASPIELQAAITELDHLYKAAPMLIGYDPPSTKDVRAALDKVIVARAKLSGQRVIIQTELGDIDLVESTALPEINDGEAIITYRINRGTEFFKVKSPDLLGQSQWDMLRDKRVVRISLLDKAWLHSYHRREHAVLPGDSLECDFEEKVEYDQNQNEIARSISIIRVIKVVPPALQSCIGAF